MCWKVWLESWLSSSQFPRSAVALSSAVGCYSWELQPVALPPTTSPPSSSLSTYDSILAPISLPAIQQCATRLGSGRFTKICCILCKLLNRVHGCKNELAQNPTKVKLILNKKMFSENGLSPHPAHLHCPPCHCQPGKALAKNKCLFDWIKEGFQNPWLRFCKTSLTSCQWLILFCAGWCWYLGRF